MLAGVALMALLAFTTLPVTAQNAEAEKPAAEESAAPTEATAQAEETSPVPATNVYAIFMTSMGNFTAKLEMERAPRTAANFKGLAEGSLPFVDPQTRQRVTRPYYDGLIFHRVARNFVIQGGCPQGNGRGGPGHSIDLEIHPQLRHTKGALSMARSSDPNSAGSQFFVTLAPTPSLDGAYAVFGYVIDGQDVVDAIGQVPIRPQMGPTDGRPVQDVRMNRVVIVEGDDAAWRARLAELTQ
jgi:peptidyl-prolyl cis-trans isomerase A (cyclophilin A)